MILPEYVSLNGVQMRLTGKGYWRDAGLWGVNCKTKNGRLLSSPLKQWNDRLHGVELIPISEEEWRKGNDGYISHITSAQTHT